MRKEGFFEGLAPQRHLEAFRVVCGREHSMSGFVEQRKRCSFCRSNLPHCQHIFRKKKKNDGKLCVSSGAR